MLIQVPDQVNVALKIKTEGSADDQKEYPSQDCLVSSDTVSQQKFPTCALCEENADAQGQVLLCDNIEVYFIPSITDVCMHTYFIVRCFLALPSQVEEMDLSEIKQEPSESKFPLKQTRQWEASSPVPAKLLNRWKARRNMSLKTFRYFLQSCAAMPPSIRRVLRRGPIRLAACPACTAEYKNSPDRLLLLLNHISKEHKKSAVTLLKDIFNNYYPLIKFMEREVIAKLFSNLKA